ncbi:MAG: redoxin domain-containing protein [Candidatus Zixiibacteriota bacterium]
MANTATSNYKDFIIKAVIICVTIAAGVYLGMFIAVRTGLTGGGNQQMPPDQMRNTTNLEIGDQFPDLQIADADGNQISINTLLDGRKTIVAFVAEGCKPCHDLMEYFKTSEVIREKQLGVLILTQDPTAFAPLTDFPVYGVTAELMNALSIQGMPTLIGVESKKGLNIVKFATGGFGYDFTEGILNKYF